MRLGFVSAILVDLPFEEVVDFAAENGYDCVEMLCWPKGKAERRYAGVTHVDVGTLDDAAVLRINGYLRKKGVEISALGYYPNPLDADEKQALVFIEHITKVIAAAKKLGLDTFNTFIGRDHTRSLEANFKKFRKLWPPIINYAESQGIRVGIENCPMYFTGDEWPGGKNLAYCPAIWRRMFEEIPSPNFGLNYDPSHLVWQQIDYVRPIYEFKKRIFHVHLKDARVDWDHLNQVGIMATPLEFHTPKLPGLGDVNWRKFFSALTDIQYQGPVVVEVEDRAFEGNLESCKAALVQSRNYIRQFLST
jgi:sugar phosphate isomerase/epimerase